MQQEFQFFGENSGISCLYRSWKIFHSAVFCSDWSESMFY